MRDVGLRGGYVYIFLHAWNKRTQIFRVFLITLDQGHIKTVKYQIARKDKYETGDEDDLNPILIRDRSKFTGFLGWVLGKIWGEKNSSPPFFLVEKVFAPLFFLSKVFTP